MSCSDCEPLLSAQLQVVRDELRADTDQQLDELRRRVCMLCAEKLDTFYICQ